MNDFFANIQKFLGKLGVGVTALVGKSGNLAATVDEVSKIAPVIIQDVQNLEPIVMQFFAHLKSGQKPTQAEWDALHAAIDAATAELMKPLPPA